LGLKSGSWYLNFEIKKGMKKNIITLFACLLFVATTFAGNPDRQGEAGAYELLLNPWARSVGLNMMNVSTVKGIEAANMNIAGLSRIKQMEVGLGTSLYLQGTDISVNALGFAQRMGENGALGVAINAMSFGKIPVTTNALPEGTGATFSPTFFNLAVSYSHLFAKKVSVGVTVRLINESLADVSAFGFSIDAGVQYMTGSTEYPERFKFGISLRNVGSPMRFGGQGLNFSTINPDGTAPYQLSYSKQAASFELPSQLNIGAAYDILPDADKIKLTALASFASNAFSRDDAGGALEISFKNIVAIRGGYKYELGTTAANVNKSVYTGISGGISFNIPFKKESEQAISVDYGYLHTRVWNGTHNISLRINL
jgi:hypothetical protein